MNTTKTQLQGQLAGITAEIALICRDGLTAASTARKEALEAERRAVIAQIRSI
jgi:hypothetical protein